MLPFTSVLGLLVLLALTQSASAMFRNVTAFGFDLGEGHSTIEEDAQVYKTLAALVSQHCGCDLKEAIWTTSQVNSDPEDLNEIRQAAKQAGIHAKRIMFRQYAALLALGYDEQYTEMDVLVIDVSANSGDVFLISRTAQGHFVPKAYMAYATESEDYAEQRDTVEPQFILETLGQAVQEAGIPFASLNIATVILIGETPHSKVIFETLQASLPTPFSTWYDPDIAPELAVRGAALQHAYLTYEDPEDQLLADMLGLHRDKDEL